MDTPNPQCLGAAAVLTKHTLNKTQQRNTEEKKSGVRGRKWGRKVCLFDCQLKIPRLTAPSKTKVLETAFVRPLSGFGRMGRIPRETTTLTPESTEPALFSQTQRVHSALLLQTSRLPQD